AGTGFRPVLQLSERGIKDTSSLLETHGALVLEGLELRRVGESPDALKIRAVVRVHGSSAVYVAHCRFFNEGASNGLLTGRTSHLVARNCEFNTNGYHAIGTSVHSKGRVVAEGCLFLRKGFNLWDTADKSAGAHYSFNHNTFVGNQAFHVRLVPEGKQPGGATKSIRWEAANNVVHVSNGVFMLFHDKEASPPFAAEEAETYVKNLVDWREGTNLYRPKQDFFSFQPGFKPTPLSQERRTLKDWLQFWGVEKSESAQSQPLFKGDVEHALKQFPDRITP